jgi:putative salt-induced outer membrane protein
MPPSFLHFLFVAAALVSAPALAQSETIQSEPPLPGTVRLEASPLFIHVAPPPALPPAVRLMIETAIAEGDEAAARHVIAIARKVAPGGDHDIDAIEQAWNNSLAARAAEQEEERLAGLRNAGPLDAWSGHVELGSSRSTGTSSNLGAFASINLERATIDWSHRLVASANVQQTNGDTSAERLLGSWQPNYRIRNEAYAFGLAQYERDPFAGYDARATLGAGMGYRPLDTPILKLELEGGPAVRYTNPIDDLERTHLVGRGSINLQWQIMPTLKLTQQTAVFLETKANNAAATTTLDTKLIGKLKTRISYNVQYEDNTPLGTGAFNTQSRVTFLLGF